MFSSEVGRGARKAGICAVMFCLLSLPICYAQRQQGGKLLLNMLIKNEAEHLDRSLPEWAPLVDFWIVGVDDHNTDNSEEIIRKHLGHIPGEIMIVQFDGMGPTWTKLVERGIEAYPNATHGIISDADFTPLTKRLDKTQLRLDCSKHMYRIRSYEGSTVRNMDWIYRNLPGAKVERRTHQSVTAPPIPGQQVFQTLIDLEVQEYTGGYQDRSGNKSARYMGWLHKDLEERPNDPRTVYYIGHAHLEQAGPNPAQDIRNGHGPGHYHLNEALKYFRWRADIRQGYYEERWFAMLKAGEICERYMADYECSIGMWTRASELDPERADSWFYIGQHWRLAQVYDTAISWLSKAVKIEKPPRSMFQWEYLYDCLRHLEMGRAVMYAPSASGKSWKLAKKSLQRAMSTCPNERDEVRRMLERAENEVQVHKAKKAEAKEKEKEKEKEEAAKAKADAQKAKEQEEVMAKTEETGEEDGKRNDDASGVDTRRADSAAPAKDDGAAGVVGDKSTSAGVSVKTDASTIAFTLETFAEWYKANKAALRGIHELHDKSFPANELFPSIARVYALTVGPTPACELYLEEVQPYLMIFNASMPTVQAALTAKQAPFWTDWLVNTMRLWAPCRGMP